MKAHIFAAAAFSLLTVALAQFHGKPTQSDTKVLGSPFPGHRHVHPRADVTLDVTEYVTVTAPEVIVWINDQGGTVSIETRTNSVAASTPAPISAVVKPSTKSTPIAPTQRLSSSFAAPSPLWSEQPTETLSTPTLTPTADPAASTSDAPPAGTTDASTSAPPGPPPSASPAPQVQRSNFGVAWSPYNADSTCKSQDQVDCEFATLAGTGFTLVRIYGVDCNQIAMTIAAVQKYNMAIFAGLVNLQDLGDNLAAIISQVGSNWSMIDTVNIGNELVNDGLASVSEVVAALGTARATLYPAGFMGRIVTVDVFDTILANPQLCYVSDYCAANCHAFFDNQITSSQAGGYVSGILAQITQQIPGKEVMITESGWPWSGNANGAAVPSVADQQAAIGSLRSAFANNPASLILFDSFDDPWKQPGPYSVEQYFGVYGH